MKIFLCFIMLFLTSSHSYSQESTNTTWCIQSQAAEFPGGIEAFKKYLQRNIQKSLSTDLQQFPDTVVAKFKICKDGTIRDVVIIEGLNEAIDAEVVRLIYRSPYWKPGKQDGRSIEVSYTMPIPLNLIKAKDCF